MKERCSIKSILVALSQSKYIFKILEAGVVVLSTLSIAAIVYTSVHSAVNYTIDLFSKQAFDCFLKLFFTQYKELYECTIIVVTAYFAAATLRNGQMIEQNRSLSKIREMLNSPENVRIHSNLMDNGPWHVNSEEFMKQWNDNEQRAHIFNYIGILEYLSIMIKTNVINKDDARRQFGYRVEEVINCHPLLDNLKREAPYWKDFFDLVKLFDY